MKKFRFSLVGVAMLALATITTRAQTWPTNQITPAATTTSTNAAPPTASAGTWADLLKTFEDLDSDLIQPLNLDTNKIISLRAGAGINTVDHRPVVAIMATVPVSALAAVGFVGAYANNSFQEGGADLTLGVTNDVPMLGTMQEFAGDGVVYDFRRNGIANYSFTGIEKYFTLSQNATLGFGAVIANTSDEPGIDIIAGGNFTFNF